MCDVITSTVSLYQQNQSSILFEYSTSFYSRRLTGKIPEVAHFTDENPENTLLDCFPRLHDILNPFKNHN